MADFFQAYKLTLKNEGFLSNDPDDKGGLTVFGIARNMNPDWYGWSIFDELKTHPDYPEILKTDTNFQNAVWQFYKFRFWNKLRGDEINSQQIANALFDDAVNSGVIPAIKKMQATLGILETGVMGDATLLKLNS